MTTSRIMRSMMTSRKLQIMKIDVGDDDGED